MKLADAAALAHRRTYEYMLRTPHATLRLDG